MFLNHGVSLKLVVTFETDELFDHNGEFDGGSILSARVLSPVRRGERPLGQSVTVASMSAVASMTRTKRQYKHRLIR